jgi:hypothetical protein
VMPVPVGAPGPCRERRLGRPPACGLPTCSGTAGDREQERGRVLGGGVGGFRQDAGVGIGGQDDRAYQQVQALEYVPREPVQQCLPTSPKDRRSGVQAWSRARIISRPQAARPGAPVACRGKTVFHTSLSVIVRNDGFFHRIPRVRALAQLCSPQTFLV